MSSVGSVSSVSSVSRGSSANSVSSVEPVATFNSDGLFLSKYIYSKLSIVIVELIFIYSFMAIYVSVVLTGLQNLIFCLN